MCRFKINGSPSLAGSPENNDDGFQLFATRLHASAWQQLRNYLAKERREGKTEFRISFQDDNHFIIHPMDKDGKTIDLTLSGIPPK